jgi:hypothetical protein
VTATDGPWWSTPGTAPDAGADPLEAHRAARRGDPPGPDDTAPADDGSWWVPAAEAVTRLARELSEDAPSGEGTADGRPRTRTSAGGPDDGGSAGVGADDGGGGGSGGGSGGGTTTHRIDACGVCPICIGLRALGEARPELVVHLAEAARHLALAVRTVVDAATDGGEAAPPGTGRAQRSRPRDGLQHIDLDGD